jgi:hypothetical protein
MTNLKNNAAVPPTTVRIPTSPKEPGRTPLWPLRKAF